MIRAALFDLDGTLTDTLTDISGAMNRALRLHGLPEWPREAYRMLVGNGARVLASRCVRERQDLAEAVLKDYQEWYGRHSLVATQPYPGIAELLRGLADRGIALCVLSNKPDADTKRVVGHFFPETAFACVRGQRPGVPVKPDPTAALAIAAELGFEPGEFLYVGDSGVDMTCANAAGMRAVGACWGYRSAEELLENGAARLARTPADVLSAAEDTQR
ncbi:MAG: HAD family hydrolase [Clostridia bacterium]|nr:HAD family hydrolase [Clostridia bacterium]